MCYAERFVVKLFMNAGLNKRDADNFIVKLFMNAGRGSAA